MIPTAEENRQARLERVEGFQAGSAEELAEEVTLWLRAAEEKVVLQREFLYSNGVYVAFIIYTE